MLSPVLILVSALCLDAFVASAAYGTNQIHISHGQIALFNGICSGVLGLSLVFGSVLEIWIPAGLTKNLCFLSLLLLGFLKISDCAIKKYLKGHEALSKNASFKILNVHFIINIYSDPMKADADRDKNLSWREIIYFSLAMSVDSLISGVTAAFMDISVPVALAAAFLIGEMFTYAGLYLGRKISSRSPKDLSWLSGILFICLAFIKGR